MNYEAFKKEFQNRIHSYLPLSYSSWKLVFRDVYKVNERLDAVTAFPPDEKREKKGAYPMFYLQDLYQMYEAGIEMRKILHHAADLIEKTPMPRELRDVRFDLERFKDCVVFELIHWERNQELLKTLPHRRFLDLAVIYRILVFDEDGQWAGMLVTKDIMKSWKLKETDLYQMAWDHTPEALPFEIRGTGRIFQSGIILEEGQNRMCILTNDSEQFGAAAMLYPDVLELAAEQFGGGFAILPGSIHELYLIKETPETAESWKHAVYVANRELVSTRDFLSDSVYYYDAETKTINILP